MVCDLLGSPDIFSGKGPFITAGGGCVDVVERGLLLTAGGGGGEPPNWRGEVGTEPVWVEDDPLTPLLWEFPVSTGGHFRWPPKMTGLLVAVSGPWFDMEEDFECGRRCAPVNTEGAEGLREVELVVSEWDGEGVPCPLSKTNQHHMPCTMHRTEVKQT